MSDPADRLRAATDEMQREITRSRLLESGVQATAVIVAVRGDLDPAVGHVARGDLDLVVFAVGRLPWVATTRVVRPDDGTVRVGSSIAVRFDADDPLIVAVV